MAGMLIIAGATVSMAAPAGGKPRQGSAGEAPSSGVMQKLSGVWIEGPGFDVTYGGNYDGCAGRCLANPGCAMIEYYRPEKKCNLYDNIRPRKNGGSSDVGIRR